MSRDRNRIAVAAAVVAVALTVPLVLVVVSRKPAESTGDSSAKSISVRRRIEILLDAAQKADAQRFLDCFAEPLRSQVKERLAERPDSLGRSEAELKSFVCPPEADAVSGDEAVVVVEKIYPETTERVRFRLTRVDGDWKIAEMQPLDRHAPATKYGTPVFRVR